METAQFSYMTWREWIEFVRLDLRVKFSSNEVEVAWCFICHGNTDSKRDRNAESTWLGLQAVRFHIQTLHKVASGKGCLG